MANRLEPGQFFILIFLTDFKLKQRMRTITFASRLSFNVQASPAERMI